MFNFGKFLPKKAITIDPTEIERKKKISRRHEILLRIQCCHQKCQNRKKKKIPKYFLTKSPFFTKVQNFRKANIYFWILEVHPVILTTYLPVLV